MSKIFDLIKEERQRQEDEICLIASENYTSENVMKAVGSVLTNKYAEGYVPKDGQYRRYYAGCKYIDEIEQYAIDRCCELFDCKYANVQPHSGSQANQAVYLALCKSGDTILGMSLDSGGHLTHGSKVSSSGKLYNAVSYGLTKKGLLNYKEIKEKLYEHHPRVLVVGASAYSREIDFKKIRKILNKYHQDMWKNCLKDPGIKNNHPEIFFESCRRCYLMVDMAHIAGLVAAGLHPSPILYADVVTSTTHKTLRGPRGGIILTNNEELAKKIDKAVFPGIQGGPLEHIIAGKAICFEEALTPSFRKYQEQVLKNIKAMEEVFNEKDVKMVSGGSDNHLILLDLTKEQYSGKELEELLENLGIICNKNAINGDKRSKLETSGIRIGTAAITTRGMKEKEARIIAEIIAKYIKSKFDLKLMQETDKDIKLVKKLCKKFPIYKKKGSISVKRLFHFI